MALFLLPALVLGPHRLEFDNDEDVEDEDEGEGDGEPEEEGVERERGLAIEEMLAGVVVLF